MELLDFLIIVGAVLFILLLWGVIGWRQLKYLKKKIREQWEVVLQTLAKRSDLLPNLIETVKKFDTEHEVLIERMIQERIKAAREYYPGSKKIEYEHDLTDVINEMFALGDKNIELKRDTNFLELKKEVDDLEQNIEQKTKKYNQMVREYNSNRKSVYLKPLATIMGYKVENIFEVEV